MSRPKLPATRFNKINPTLDREHMAIFKALDNLYAACDKHWVTEDKLFKQGLTKLPQNHKTVKSDINKHRKHHSESLQQIVNLKYKLMNHINGEDTEHFHWL